ncbi:MAG: DUF72 domain-containing protein [Planctomycetota bacterium]
MSNQEEKAEVVVGTAGWDYPDWKGVFYPQPMRKGEHPLSYLSSFFDAVEINSTYYHPPRADFAARWIRYVEGNRNFMFTAKLWQRFTHQRKSRPTEEEVDLFKSGIAPLVETNRFGGLLVQFPWSFKNKQENLDWLCMVLDMFTEFPISLEVRHASWNVPEIYELLHRKKVGICNIDQPLFNHSIAPDSMVTSRLGYIRLHGQNYKDWFREDANRDERYNYLYQEEELTPWVEKIQRMRETTKRIFVITNNHYRGQAAVNGLQLLHKLSGQRVKVPDPLLNAYPQLARIREETAHREQGRLPGF